MAFADLPTTLQNVLEVQYDYQAKVILLFGFYLLSLFYVFYLYKSQKPTPYFFLGTFRAICYSVCYFWLWLFWLLIGVYIHPAVPVDSLLIFIASIYSILSFVFMVLFVFNFTVWIPKFIITRGKIDVSTWEDKAFKKYFGNWEINWKK